MLDGNMGMRVDVPKFRWLMSRMGDMLSKQCENKWNVNLNHAYFNVKYWACCEMRDAVLENVVDHSMWDAVSFYVRCGFILCEMRCWKMLSIDIILLPIFIVLPRISEFVRPCDPKNCLIQYLSRGLPVFVFQWLGALDKVLHFAEIQMVVETH